MPNSKKSFGRKVGLLFAALFSCISITAALILSARLKLLPGTAPEALSGQSRLILGITFISLIFVVLISLAVGEFISRRIRKMTVVTMRFAKGQLSQGLPIEADDELGVLADSVNHIVLSLKKRLSEIENEKTKLSAILNNMAEGVFGVDHDHTILIMNPSAASILNLGKKNAAGKGLLEVIQEPAVDVMMGQAIEEGKNLTKEIELSHPERKTLQVNAVGISKAEGDICGILVFHDVTQMKQLERMRSEFVANVSHELRTPLTSINGFIETLLGGALRDPQQSARFLQIMQEDTNRLKRLIDDLLELSSIESKLTPLRLVPLILREETERAAGTLAPKIAEKKIRIENKLPKENPQDVLADRDKLQQILVNLLDNAVKFNRNGGTIVIDGARKGDMVAVSIKDFGVGIPEDLLPRVFERFFRVDSARSREAGGTGLGLAIVKHLVEAHQGRVNCSSEIGKGTTFTFTLPAAK